MPSLHPSMTLRHGTARPRRGGANTLARVALLADVVALMLLVPSFGILSLPLAAFAMAMAAAARRRLDAGASAHGHRVVTAAWWLSVLAALLTLIALVVLALDLTGAGGPGEAVEEAR